MHRMMKWTLFAGTASVVFQSGFFACRNSTVARVVLEVWDVVAGAVVGGLLSGIAT